MSLFHTEPNPTDTSTAEIPVRNADGSAASYTPDELKVFARGDFVINGENVAKDDPRFLCHLTAQKAETLNVQITTTAGTEFWVINGVAQAAGADLTATVAVGDMVSLFAPNGSSAITSIDTWSNSKLEGDISKLLDGGNITSITISGNNKLLSADVDALFLLSPVVTYSCNGLSRFRWNSRSIADGVSAGTLVTLRGAINECALNFAELDAVSTLTDINLNYCDGLVYGSPSAPTYNADMSIHHTPLSNNADGVGELLSALVASGVSGKTLDLRGGAMPSALVAADKAALEAAGNTVHMTVF